MKTFSKATLFILLVTLLFVTATGSTANAGAYKVGDFIADFSLPDGITGEKVSFKDDIKGKGDIIMIAFITTTCSACKSEMTLLSKLVDDNGEKLKLYAISVDINGKTTVPLYDKTFNFKTRYMLDPDFRVPQKFGFSFAPSLVVAKSDGEVLYLKGGFSDETADELAEIIEDALR